MTWYIARWGRIRQIEVIKETLHRVKYKMATSSATMTLWANKQTAESLITQDFMRAKIFLIDMAQDNIDRLASSLTDEQHKLVQLRSLTIEDTKTQ